MAGKDPETRSCPFCKEEVKAAAIRCKHCQADIAVMQPDHGGVCPFCKEAIRADAIQCRHCKAVLVGGARVVMGGARRPMRITTRHPAAEAVEFRLRPGGFRRREEGGPVVASDASGGCGGCAEFISTPYGTYHLVDCGQRDGWNYCGYEPGYGVFEDGDLVPYTPTVLPS